MRYRTIVADPPWDYDDRGVVGGPGHGNLQVKPLPYRSMTLDEIKALPVAHLSDPSGCNLFLWTTNRYLRPGFDVLSAWGFSFSQIAVWAKPPGSRPPVPRFALAPLASEFILFARFHGGCKLGKPWDSSVVTAPRLGLHSHKPEVFLDLIESVSPGPYLEMFARRARFGWDYWGDESLSTVEMPA